MDDHSDKVVQMLETNERQREYYSDDSLTLLKKGNLITRVWRRLRRRLLDIRRLAGVDDSLEQLHWHWLGDLSEKSILDLGCFSGNTLSLELARRSRQYTGIDLSPEGIDELNRKIREAGIEGAIGKTVDFLSDDFGNEKFDVIYAKSVFHHFEHFDEFLIEVDKHLNDNGIVITYDPLNTSKIMRFFRALYRPLQSDAEWEWPFERQSFQKIETHFDIIEKQGLVGRMKWALPLSVISYSWALRLAKSWHQRDLQEAKTFGSPFYSCTQVTMRLKKKESRNN